MPALYFLKEDDLSGGDRKVIAVQIRQDFFTTGLIS
jgi:hypothetical protein